MNYKVICHYCGSQAELVTGAQIYPHRRDLYKLSFYSCENGHDKAYVGCHRGSTKPLGILEDAELRKAKYLAHKAFDLLWRDGAMTRSEANARLSKRLGIDIRLCHINLFDVKLCLKTIDLCLVSDL